MLAVDELRILMLPALSAVIVTVGLSDLQHLCTVVASSAASRLPEPRDFSAFRGILLSHKSWRENALRVTRAVFNLCGHRQQVYIGIGANGIGPG